MFICKFSNKQISEFLYSLRIPLTFADSTYILRNLLKVAESRTTSYICLLRNPQQIKCADKIYVTSIFTRNPSKSCKWNPLTFWNMFKYLSLESRNKQKQKCAPIQCTVWPLNGHGFLINEEMFFIADRLTTEKKLIQFFNLPHHNY